MMRLLSFLPGGAPALSALNLITSRIGMALLAATIAFGFGYRAGDRNGEIERLQGQLATVKRDFDTAKGSVALGQRQATSLEAKLRTNKDRLHALQAEIQKGRRGACPLGADDALQLRNIR